MQHVAFFGLILNLIIGSWVTVYTYQIMKTYDSPFLRPLFLHTFFYNLSVLCLLLYIYFNINLPGNIIRDSMPILGEFGVFLVSLAEIGMVYSMHRISQGLRNKTQLQWGRIIIVSGVILYSLSNVFKYLLPHESSLFRFINVVAYEVFDNFLVLEIPILFVLLAKIRKIPDRDLARMGRVLGSLYLGRYVFIIGLFVIGVIFNQTVRIRTMAGSLPHILMFFLFFGIFTSFCVIPYAWIRRYFLGYASKRSRIVDDAQLLEGIYEKFNISKREREILELILEGKNNKEIEQSLFISYHTVKNHVYNLYQKIGVKNRYQLIHFFTQAFKTRETVGVESNNDSLK